MSFSMTADEAMVALTKAVALKGADFRYTSPMWKNGAYSGSAGEGCLYVHTVTPEGDPIEPEAGCIAAVALHSHGVPLSTLALHEDTSAESVVRELSRDNPGENETAASILTVAQSVQDGFGTWGDAWRAAKSRYELSGAVYPYPTLREAIAALPSVA